MHFFVDAKIRDKLECELKWNTTQQDQSFFLSALDLGTSPFEWVMAACSVGVSPSTALVGSSSMSPEYPNSLTRVRSTWKRNKTLLKTFIGMKKKYDWTKLFLKTLPKKKLKCKCLDVNANFVATTIWVIMAIATTRIECSLKSSLKVFSLSYSRQIKGICSPFARFSYVTSLMSLPCRCNADRGRWRRRCRPWSIRCGTWSASWWQRRRCRRWRC